MSNGQRNTIASALSTCESFEPTSSMAAVPRARWFRAGGQARTRGGGRQTHLRDQPPSPAAAHGAGPTSRRLTSPRTVCAACRPVGSESVGELDIVAEDLPATPWRNRWSGCACPGIRAAARPGLSGSAVVRSGRGAPLCAGVDHPSASAAPAGAFSAFRAGSPGTTAASTVWEPRTSPRRNGSGTTRRRVAEGPTGRRPEVTLW